MTDLTLKLAAKRALTDRISQFTWTAAGGAALPGWEPGAHLEFQLPGGLFRAYSLIAFAPDPDVYHLAVQREDDGDGGSKAMHALEVGVEVTATPPKCDFPITPGAPAVLLAGGIGVTPMISMAGALQDAGTPFGFHFAGRSRDAMAYLDALTDRFGDALNLHFDDDPATALNLDAVIGALSPDQHLYICGPRGMIDAARTIAEAKGIPGDRVHVELFDNATSSDGDRPFEVEIASTGETFTILPGQTIIEVLEAAGQDLMYDCQRGDCGICQTDIIEGTPDHRDVVLSEAERAEGKVMQICVSRAKSAKLVLDL